MKICHLNVYVLIKIFKYCDENDIENLYLVCTQFRNIIESGIYYGRSLKLLMTGHKDNTRNCQRTYSKLSYRDRIKIHENWLNGRYNESVLFHHRKWYPSKIFLDADHFYMSHGHLIKVHRRNERDIIDRSYKEISSETLSDVSHFVKKGNTIFAGRVCGSCFIYENDYVTEQRLHDLKEYLMAVDFSDTIFVTSTDKTSKLWSKNFELGLINFEEVQDFKESYKCMRISENGYQMACGKYTDINRRALKEIDLETGQKQIYNSDTLSVYDLLYKDENVILSGHFDTTVRLFDRRSNSDESIWSDPFDASIYCLEYDGLYGVICGVKYHCRVNLYDIRVPNKYMQMYFPALRKNYGSPVYSIACDSRHLMIATDHNLRVFDFKASWATVRDYRNIFVNL